MKNTLTVLSGFFILFILYHGAEYMIVFQNSALGFLSFHLAFVMAAYLIGKWQFGKGLQTWGFIIGKKWSIQLLAGCITGVLLYSVTFCIALKSGAEQIQYTPPADKIPGVFGLFVFGNFFSSFSEDVLTRAYIHKHFHHRWNAILLTVFSAVVYVLNHIYRLTDGFETISYLFLLGILLFIPFIKTKQIWLTGSIHWAGNCTFYFTHQIWKTTGRATGISPNYIFCLVLMVCIIIAIVLPKKFYGRISC